MPSQPAAYLITFSCYGTRLHGDESGSVDRLHYVFGTPHLAPNKNLERVSLSHLRESPYELDSARQKVVLRSIWDTCLLSEWELHAAHIRTTHTHSIVSADCDPKSITGQFKGNAVRSFKEHQFDLNRKLFWTRGESNRYLWAEEDLANAVLYVIERQGKPMEYWFKGMPEPAIS